MTSHEFPTAQGEQQLRADLATLYRLVAHFRMTDLIDTHISARIPGARDEFLINRYGVLFHEMTPADLVKVDASGSPIEGAAQLVNQAGFVIHSAIHAARHDISCVIHTHTADGMAVSCQKHGLLPITQHALRFEGCLSYHAYEGIALDIEERERLVRDLGNNKCMVLRNHGLLACGSSIPEAFVNIMYLERACQVQVRALGGGADIELIPDAVRRRTREQFHGGDGTPYFEKVWTAASRLVNQAPAGQTP